jgi:hypothetical protein
MGTYGQACQFLSWGVVNGLDIRRVSGIQGHAQGIKHAFWRDGAGKWFVEVDVACKG